MIRAAYARLGTAEVGFECCTTRFTIRAMGWGADRTVERARRTVHDLERQLNAFDPESAVARLNDEGRVENRHVARLVERGLDYAERTDGVFDVRRGRLEHDLKAYIRGDEPSFDAPSGTTDRATVQVDGDVVTTSAPLDLNGLAKGYIVDRAAAALDAPGRTGFVNGGGDVANPTGPVGIESPYGEDTPLKVLDTAWNVATSGNYRRERDGVDHIYDPSSGRVGAESELVTVVARRSCLEADVLATTLSALAVDDALALADGWDGVEALVVTHGVLHETGGFENHAA